MTKLELVRSYKGGADFAMISYWVDYYKRHYYWLKENQDWETHWEAVKVEIYYDHLLEILGEREPFFSSCGYGAIKKCCLKREADFYENMRESVGYLAGHAGDYEISSKEIDDDELGNRYRDYEAARPRTTGFFFDQQSGFDQAPDELVIEKEGYEQTLELINSLKDKNKNGSKHYKIAMYFLKENDLEPKKHGPIPHLAKQLNKSPRAISTLKDAMIKQVVKGSKKTTLDLEQASNDMKERCLAHEKIGKSSAAEISGEYKKVTKEMLVVKTTIASIDQLMDEEIRALETVYCNRPSQMRKQGPRKSKTGNQGVVRATVTRGMSYKVRSAIYDRPSYMKQKCESDEEEE